MWWLCSAVLSSHRFPSPLRPPWPRLLPLASASPLALQAVASQSQEEGEASWLLCLGGALARNAWGRRAPTVMARAAALLLRRISLLILTYNVMIFFKAR